MAGAVARQQARRTYEELWASRRPPLSHYEFAKTLFVPDSEDEYGDPDAYHPRSHPAQHHVLRLLDGDESDDLTRHAKLREYLLVADTQSGKSWLLQQILFHAVVERGETIIYALPSRDLAGDTWDMKIRTAFINAGLGMYLPTHGPGSKGGSKPRTIKLRRVGDKGGGRIIFMSAGGRGQSGQAAHTAKYIIIDEVDDWEPDQLERMLRRADRYAENAQIFLGSTIKKDPPEKSVILENYEDSNMCRLAYECPACHEHTRLLFEKFDHDKSDLVKAGETARVLCEHCDHPIDEDARQVMLGKSMLVGGKEHPKRFGLKWTALDCPWKSLGYTAQSYVEATFKMLRGLSAPLIQFVRDQRVEQFDASEMSGDATAKELTREALDMRSKLSTWGEAMHDEDDVGREKAWSHWWIRPPEEARACTLAVDVQNTRMYWLLVAWDENCRSWDCAWGYRFKSEDKQPLRPEDYRPLLTEIEAVARDIAENVPIVMKGVDVGTYTGDLATTLKSLSNWHPVDGKYAQTKVRELPGILALEKPGPKEQPLVGYDRLIIHADEDLLRESVQSSYLIQPGEAGASHLPQYHRKQGESVQVQYFHQHLTRVRLEEKDGRRKWKEVSPRHDLLDCKVYARALFHFWFEFRESVPNQQQEHVDEDQSYIEPYEGVDWI